MQAVGVLGLAYALFYTFVGSTKQQKKAALAAQRQARLKAQVLSAAAKLAPLDPAIPKLVLPHEHKRWLLGLYNGLDGGDEGVTPSEWNHVHRKAELILNHLGLLVQMHDVNAALPGDAEMAKFRGVIAWYDKDKLRKPLDYLKWLRAQAAAGRKIVLLGGLKAASDMKGTITPASELAATFAALGIEYKGNFTDDPQRIQLVSKDPAVVEFERKLPRFLEFYEQYKPTAPERSTTFLKLRRSDLADGESHMVLITPQGGFVAPAYVLNEQQFANNYVMQWRINPFVFFARAFDVTIDHPRPDFTTLNGSRIYYSHIDGDGLPSITEVNRKAMCADFTRTQILEPFDLPVTVSFVVAGLDPKAKGDAYRLAVARKIARLPNVEVAAHGFAHPMDWRARAKAQLSYDVKGYKMNAAKEIEYATTFINEHIAPPGKATRVMLWTGWCNPAEDQLAIAYKLGLYNLNGGDPVMDAQFPSYLHLAPPMHKVGKYTQYFTSGPNDYILTEEWQPPFHRFANLIQTLRRTGYPRRIYPMNLYYHFYVVEKPAALKAIKDILTWVEQRQPAPLWVSAYIDIIRDFETLRISREGANGPSWRVHNSGHLRTIRFDRTDKHVDLAASKGVLGYRIAPRLKVMYVHLDESHDHLIVLGDAPSTQPHLLKASSYLHDVKLSLAGASLRMEGFGKKYLTIGRLRSRADYRVVADNGEGKRLEAKVFTDAGGTLNWSGSINGPKVLITIKGVKP